MDGMTFKPSGSERGERAIVAEPIAGAEGETGGDETLAKLHDTAGPIAGRA